MLNVLEKIQTFIKFVDENLLGIIFLISIFYIIWHYCIHNFYIKKRFKREKIEKKENFEIARCKEENTKNRIYLVIYKKNSSSKGKYRHIENNYTFKKLGYNSGDDVPRNGKGSYVEVKEDIYKKKDEEYEKIEGEIYKKINKKEFSRKNKKLGARIELRDIKRDIAFIIGSASKIKELKEDIGEIK